jgi:hypothetical protein
MLPNGHCTPDNLAGVAALLGFDDLEKKKPSFFDGVARVQREHPPIY